MGLSRIIPLFCAVSGALIGGPAIYQVEAGRLENGLKLYREEADPNFVTLREMLYGVIRRQATSDAPQDRLAAIYAIKLARDRNLYGFLPYLADDPDPSIQLAAIQLTAASGEDFVEEVLLKAMSSRFWLMRFEAAHLYSSLNLSKALGQIEALIYKAPEQAAPFFPELLSRLDEDEARAHFRKLLHHPNEEVRIRGVLEVGRKKLLEFLPEVRTLASQLNLKLQEAGATVFGELADGKSVDLLKKMAQSREDNLRVAASLALYRMGDLEERKALFTEAGKKNLFAIFALREVAGSEVILRQLLEDPNREVRLNATLALLEREDPAALKKVDEVLLSTLQDFAFLPTFSGGKTLLAFRCIPSAHVAFRKNPYAHEVSLQLREVALGKVQKFGSTPFLKVCEVLFRRGQLDLVPAAIEYLAMQGGEEELKFLRQFKEMLGVPLIRGYAKLALFQLGDQEVTEETLFKMAQDLEDKEALTLRAQLPLEMRGSHAAYELTPEENSRLLTGVYLSLADRRSEKGIRYLLQALESARNENKALIAAALLHAIR